MKPEILIAVQGAAVLPLDALEPFQGDLKRLERAEYEQFRESILKNGYTLAIHVWQNEGHNYLIDGHQRVTGLKMMREEGYEVPDLPVALVFADDFASAKRKVLAAISTYGKMTEQSLYEYLKVNDIPFDEVVATYKFPEINVNKLSELFEIPDGNTIPTPPPGQGNTPEMPSGSEGTRQVNLFFSAADHEEFMNCVSHLSQVYGTENITDTLLRCVREANQSHQPQP